LGDIAKFKMLVRGPPKEGDYLTIKESKTPKKSDRHGSQRIWMIAAIAPRVKSNQYNMTVKLQVGLISYLVLNGVYQAI